MNKGYLILETGEIYEGKLIGSLKKTFGEVVFNTSMTGYQEIITDPSYAGQIITFCYPLIGNYGVNLIDNESELPKVEGVVISDLCESPSHFMCVQSLSDYLKDNGIPGIVGVDTRALVKTIRKYGTVKGVITDQAEAFSQIASIYDTKMASSLLVDTVSTKVMKRFGTGEKHIVLMDFGYKRSILDALLNEGCSVTVVPYTTSFEIVNSLQPDGLLLSNGPGNPQDLAPYLTDIRKMCEAFPTLGICLGHQLIALAFSASTAKLKYGHRGANHPVKELGTGKVWMTSQNHGYVVLEESLPLHLFNVTYRNVNDKSIEGIAHKYLPIESVQFHPEAHAGPSDTDFIITKFVQQLKAAGVEYYALT